MRETKNHNNPKTKKKTSSSTGRNLFVELHDQLFTAYVFTKIYLNVNKHRTEFMWVELIYQLVVVWLHNFYMQDLFWYSRYKHIPPKGKLNMEYCVQVVIRVDGRNDKMKNRGQCYCIRYHSGGYRISSSNCITCDDDDDDDGRNFKKKTTSLSPSDQSILTWEPKKKKQTKKMTSTACSVFELIQPDIIAATESIDFLLATLQSFDRVWYNLKNILYVC